MINYYLPTDEYVILILILTIITMINYYLPTEYVIPIFIIAIFDYQNLLRMLSMAMIQIQRYDVPTISTRNTTSRFENVEKTNQSVFI